MKNKLFLLLLIFACSVNHTQAQITNNVPDKKIMGQPNVAPKIFRVLSIEFTRDSSNTHGTTRDTYFTETITYAGTGVVNYTMYHTEESANTRQYPNGILSNTSTGSFTLTGTGTDIIQVKKSAFYHSGHSLKIVTDTPNQVTSNLISY